jgi:ATP-dependent DNA helicase RecG
LLIGVDDQNQIEGVDIDNAKRSAIQNSIGEINPKIQCSFDLILVDGKQVAVLVVPSGKYKPYVFTGAIFVRVGPNTQKLTTAEEMRDFFQQADKIHFDESTCPGFALTTHFDQSVFAAFRTDARFHSFFGQEQILQNLQLFTEEGHFKNGAVLFFGLLPSVFFPQAIIRCVAFLGTEKRFIKDDKKFEGPLYQQFLQTMDWLRGKLDVAYDIEGQGAWPRQEVWEIPETVFKEALINALSHRDYYEKGAVITVEVFSDRVEIANPGGQLLAIKNEFGRRSLSSNPLIFGLFEKMHLVEKIGSGIPRMEELMRSHQLPPPGYRTEGMFTIILKRKSSEKIIHLLQKDLDMTIDKLSAQLGKSTRTVEKQLKKLRETGKISRVGPDKGGKWLVHILREN